ncbi:hypothetical protein SAY87_004917 [Trapa incisa]|uniref:Subtilisin-like protease SBT1.9 n=1 Tax=Trapa incisa TaxID=236973 RepID=A0AAN7JQ21_9MYRT|nr:hypothetical protein SAY87_004917 [Trapa incisa]
MVPLSPIRRFLHKGPYLLVFFFFTLYSLLPHQSLPSSLSPSMAPPTQFFLFMCCLLRSVFVFGESDNYIVHMDLSLMPKIFTDHHSWYSAVVESALASSKAASMKSGSFLSNSKFIYSYLHAIQGFSAHLSPGEHEAIKNTPGYISSVRDLPVKPDTTHSSQFLGLAADTGAWPTSSYGEEVIIGIVDTGVWPESSSFKDSGMSQIPARWKGECQAGVQFNASMCNRKLIGARYFNKGITAKNPNMTLSMNSTRDTEGHGTHTSSTAAGNYVEDASFFGYAPGTARGMAPRARVAMYKALWQEGGFASDIIAAVDQAISDGVDVLSLSLGLDVMALYLDPVAIASYAANEKGIFVTTSAGNEGPFGASLHNGTPWSITVAAGDMDRDYVGVVTLGNGVRLEGTTLFPGNPLLPQTPTVFMGFCNNTVALSQVGRKIVVCEDKDDLLADQINYIQAGNISGGIFITDKIDIEQYIESQLPAVFVDQKVGETIKNYVRNSSGKTEAGVEFGRTVIGGRRAAPRVASYSSRGPSPSCPFVLKPDVLAPGSLILAAWPEKTPTTLVGSDFVYSKYNLLSGTSMSTPHVAGVAALLKAARPEWSPAAIRSAIMTTSYSTDNTNRPIRDLGGNPVGSPANPLAMGAGHIDPNKALNPGLVYDATTEDYNNLLCGLNYTAKEIQTITRSSSTTICSNPTLDLNYPSFIALLDFSKTPPPTAREFHRTVTNVDEESASYFATVTPVKGYKVTIEPKELIFKEKFEKLSYKLTIEGPIGGVQVEDVAWGHVSWIDRENKYEVKSPIVATTYRIE